MSTQQELLKKIYDLKLELSELRKSATPELVKDYHFQTAEGSTTLANLFGDKNELIIVHNMGESCDYCTMWADGFQGYMPYITNRASVVIVNGDPIENQVKRSTERKWKTPVVQDPGATFTTEMGYFDGKYWAPGVSTFKKMEDGSIVRTGHSPLGPLDDFNPVWHFWDLLDGNKTEWHPDSQMFTS